MQGMALVVVIPWFRQKLSLAKSSNCSSALLLLVSDNLEEIGLSFQPSTPPEAVPVQRVVTSAAVQEPPWLAITCQRAANGCLQTADLGTQTVVVCYDYHYLLFQFV